MGFHHVALATRDTAATHAFYTEVMGFRLAKVVASPTPNDTGWSKHFFYDTGSKGMIAFWEIHDPEIGDDYPTDLNRSIGLPWWVNHLAFDAPTPRTSPGIGSGGGSTGTPCSRWTTSGACPSTSATPTGSWWSSATARDFRPDEVEEAQQLLVDPAPPFERNAKVTIHEPLSVAPA